MPGNGWCTHPKRQLSSGVKLLVRGGELACRNSWGGDLFQSRLDETDTPADADLPGGVDQVTSVSIPPTRHAGPEDRVVSDRPAPHRPIADPNNAAHRDQDERARIMARGSRDALAQARQRLSARHRADQDHEVVADDNIPETAGADADRVVTRQARFSDRFLSPNDPHEMRAEPVPREEVERRSPVPRDRFDTVPEIDPSFGHVEPNLPVASRAPEPVTIEEPSDEVTQTSYEHVLQRARRIRAAKQERLRPIRHADLLHGREQVAADEAPWFEDASAPTIHDTAPVVPAHEWEPEFPPDESLVAEAARNGEIDQYDERWETDAGWVDVDDTVDAPAPRRTWLNRLGFGQRSSAMPYDDATVTRHANAQPDWRDEDWVADDFGWEEPDRTRAERRAEPTRVHADSRHAALDDHDAPAWRTATRPTTPPSDPLPAQRESAEAQPAPGEPLRAAAPPRSRLRGVELPDLDDALFDATATRPQAAARLDQPLAGTHAEPVRHRADILDSRSPRDSYFRSSRFEQPEERQPRMVERDIYAPDPASFVEPELPDLDAERIDVRDAVARGDERGARRVEIAPDVPRQCRTCRSFRSADGGTRGWCTNEHAFTHRRMVNDDDLACKSSIGCWWLPADDVWLDPDAGIDDAPTPRMDALIARNRPAARRAAGE